MDTERTYTKEELELAEALARDLQDLTKDLTEEKRQKIEISTQVFMAGVIAGMEGKT